MHEREPLVKAGLTPTRENYLRSLYQLSRSGGGVRLTDLAQMQGVRLPTARHAVTCLRDAGFVVQENYGLITLTDQGRKLGRTICDRFELTRRFLADVLGVNDAAAEREACIMEHYLDQDTLNRIAAFVTHVTDCVAGDKADRCIGELRLSAPQPATEHSDRSSHPAETKEKEKPC